MQIQGLIELRCSALALQAGTSTALGMCANDVKPRSRSKAGSHAPLRRQPRLSVHRAAAARALRRGRRGGLQGGGAASALRPHACGAQGRDRQAWADAARHQHLRRQPARRFRTGRGARARARLGRRVQAGARLHRGDRRQRDPLHGRQGADRAAAGGGTDLHRQSDARRGSGQGQERHAADRADQPARPAELFSRRGSSRPPTSSPRSAGRTSRSSSISIMCRSSAATSSPASRSICRWSATCRSRRCRRAPSRTRARSIIRPSSRRSTGSAGRAGPPANTGPAAAPRTASAGVRPMASSALRNDPAPAKTKGTTTYTVYGGRARLLN